MENINYLSYRTTKKALYQSIQPFNYKRFMGLINPIICDNRDMHLDSAKWVIKLRSVEVLQFLNSIGLSPIGFGIPISICDKQISKKRIKELIPEVSDSEITEYLNPIIIKHREHYNPTPKWARFVSQIELESFLIKIGEPLESRDSIIYELVETEPQEITLLI